jgi:hypothetical protein
MNHVFVGHFSSKRDNDSIASSVAGNRVQREILENMKHYAAGDTQCYSMSPFPCWPRGPLLVKSTKEDLIEFIGYLNLPGLKHLFFSVKLLLRFFQLRPRFFLQYNSYLLENLCLLCYRFFNNPTVLVVVIQDIHVVQREFSFSWRYLRSLTERLSLRLARRFNYVVPISEAIISDFNFDHSRCFVFQGGVTEFAEQLMLCQQSGITEEIGVFAGALESYNGVDKLVDQWVSRGFDQTLHIFGKGSLRPYVEQAARITDRIIYHGQQPEEVINQWQCRSKWNFCLRYSANLEQRYFFPSKFFNIVCAPGAVVTNNFYGLPDALKEHINIVSDDLSNLSSVLVRSKDNATSCNLRRRRLIVRSLHSWRTCMGQIFKNAK